MSDIIRISVVSYLNSKPFIYGLKNGKFNSDVDIQEDIPSVCAEKLLSGKADIGLVPVAILPALNEYKIISDYCIGANGKVNSVLLLSEVPLQDIKTILLDYQSRTSVLLARVLAKKFWNIQPDWMSTSNDYEKDISGNTAGVIIGDRALILKRNFSYVYDLSEEWKKFTGLPFVFACWVSVRKLDEKFISEFNTALENGLRKINEIAKKEKLINLSEETIRKYLIECIDYRLDEKKKTAMNSFLEMISELSVPV